MTNIETLFCTPEQGRRLKELVPELKLNMVWYRYGDGEARPMPLPTGAASSYPFEPALTLQELRDVAKERNLQQSYKISGVDANGIKIADEIQLVSWESVSTYMTAPELAAWVIERLEADQ